MAIWMVVMLGVPAILVAVAVAVVAARSRQQANAEPRCGNCGYNLTGSTTNRCPECGELFINAGVTKQAPVNTRPQMMLVLVALGLAVLGGVGAMFFARVSAVRRLAPPVVTTAPTSAPTAAPSTQPVQKTKEQTP